MSLRKLMRTLFVYLVLEVGAIGGIPMPPQKIWEIVRTMNQIRVEQVVTNENSDT